ncbi:MAG: Gfo/Idh/MocA family oxidoreductase [Phycisphaerales bacterium]
MAYKHNLSRRDFLYTTTALGVGALTIGAAGNKAPAAQPKRPALRDTKLRVLSIGVVGTIGERDRKNVDSHPRAEIVGLCDVDAQAIAKAKEDHPDAWTCEDYREAFDKHSDKFDAVIVSTPDHSHCSIMTLALARGKHVYGQKPLVHELEELEILGRAAKARPDLVTQTGNQRMESDCRRAAVDILKNGMLGKVIEVHVCFGSSARAGDYYFANGDAGAPIQPPEGFNYDLWLNGAQYEPCHDNLIQRKWRSWWSYGGGRIGDWVIHLVDVLFFAFPELQSPTQVCTRTPSHDVSVFHADRVSSALTYEVDSDRFANSTCNVYMYDSDITPDRAQLGIGEGEWPEKYFTVVVCEGGTMVLGPSKPIEIWRDGVMTDGLTMPGLPAYEKFSHWHAWVDKALGIETPHLWTPFDAGLRCTEPGLLAVKAAKYPGQVLQWNRKKLRFDNHKEATRTLVKREYRAGFEPVRLRW